MHTVRRQQSDHSDFILQEHTAKVNHFGGFHPPKNIGGKVSIFPKIPGFCFPFWENQPASPFQKTAQLLQRPLLDPGYIAPSLL